MKQLLPKKHYDICFLKEKREALKSVFLFFTATVFGVVHAQTNAGLILKISDKNAKPVSGVSIRLFEITGSDSTECMQCADTTDADGGYTRRNLSSGTYKIMIEKEGYHPVNDIIIDVDQKIAAYREILLFKVSDIVISKNYQKPIIFRPGIPVVPYKVASPNIFFSLSPAVISTGGGLSVLGSRPGANKIMLDNMDINGIIPGLLGMNAQSLSITGIRAMYGDLTGGLFEYVTKNPSRNINAILEAKSSQGLDAFGTNSIEGFVSGPLWVKKIKNEFNKTNKEVKLGYAFSGIVNYNMDNSPGINGVYYVKEEVLKNMEENPLIIVPGNYVHRANYLTAEDIEHRKARLNSPLYQANTWGKLSFNPNPYLSLVAYGNYIYSSGFNAGNQIMNYNQNSRFDNRIIRSYLLLNHNLRVSKQSSIKNAFYQVKFEYQNTETKNRDAVHLDNLFDYGYLGKFTNYYTEQFAYTGENTPDPKRPRKTFINQFGDTVYINNYYEQTGYRDTLLTFDPGTINKTRARYTQSLFEYFNSRNTKLENIDQLLAATGLRNGDNLSNVYNLWSVPGTINTAYAKSNTQKYVMSAIGQMTYRGKSKEGVSRNPHALQFGFAYEQQVVRGYQVRANELWGLMRQLLNKQIDPNIKDPNNTIPHAILSYDKNGNFTDTVRYAQIINQSEQTAFDKNLRAKLIARGAKDVYGKPVDEYSYLSSDYYTPSEYSLDMFSADELLNNGNSLVSYYGYDYLGNKLKSKPSPEAFFNDKNARSIGAFQPVYMAAWLEDQFQFKELVFSMGLRMERYDANQFVLKDPYSLYPVKTAGEIEGMRFGNEVFRRPSNIGEDYFVYVNDIESPDQVVGYRNGDRWYNAEGVELLSPEFIANSTKTGRISPLLVAPQKQVLSRESIRDFIPLINLLPRILFSFPLQHNKKYITISYDVFSQRPPSAYSFLTIDNLYYLKQRQGNLINNSNLQSRIKTNYEVGYKQAYGNNLSNGIDLGISYSEIRKDFGLYQVIQGYPVTYNTYRNIDFSTITAFKSTFIFNKKGPFSFYFTYTYQIADGTGSNVNSQATLISSGQPNLRNIIPLGELDIRHALKGSVTVQWAGKGLNPVTKKKLYTGPVVMGKDIFRNLAINLIGNAFSGAPYTPATEPVQINSLDRQQIKGEPFGANMAWNYNFDLSINKGIQINRSKQHPLFGELFFNVTNLLNTKNVRDVYRFTGSPVDDGFLNSPKGQQAAANQVNTQSFIDMYKIYLNSNAAYGAPRRMQLGVRFYFNRVLDNN